jgi:DNA-binding CsgD family transcriptional regulator
MSTRVSRKLLLLEQWSRGVAEISAAQASERFIPVLEAGVRRLVDFDFTMVFAYRGTATPLVLGDTLDAARHRIIVNDYAAGPFMLDPFFRLVGEGRRSGCYRLHAIAPDHFRRSEYFRVHYSRTGIGEEIGVFFDLGGGLTGVTSFARWNNSPAVVRSEREILEAMAPAIGALCAGHWASLHGVREPPQQSAEAAGQSRFRALSMREREIVTMILQGHSTESIALQLDISPGTVKIHRKNIYRKMRISTQAELFAAFMGIAGAPAFKPAYSPGDMADRPEITHVQRKPQ